MHALSLTCCPSWPWMKLIHHYHLLESHMPYVRSCRTYNHVAICASSQQCLGWLRLQHWATLRNFYLGIMCTDL